MPVRCDEGGDVLRAGDRTGSKPVPVRTEPRNVSGLEYRPIIQTRHTFAPMMISAGENIGRVQRILGHTPVGGVYKAKATIVDKVVDAASGTFGVRLELPNPDYKLPPGLK